jgi:hypothetical protein
MNTLGVEFMWIKQMVNSVINGHQQIEQVIRNWEEKREVHKQEVMHLEDVHNKNNIVILNLKSVIV